MISMLLIPLILTIVFETLVLLALREYRAKVLLACVVMNILTNVPLNYYVQNICPGMSSIIFGEQLVFAVEAVCYRFVTGNWRTALIYSALCNAVSFSMGVLMLCTYELITIPKCRL